MSRHYNEDGSSTAPIKSIALMHNQKSNTKYPHTFLEISRKLKTELISFEVTQGNESLYRVDLDKEQFEQFYRLFKAYHEQMSCNHQGNFSRHHTPFNDESIIECDKCGKLFRLGEM